VFGVGIESVVTSGHPDDDDKSQHPFLGWYGAPAPHANAAFLVSNSGTGNRQQPVATVHEPVQALYSQATLAAANNVEQQNCGAAQSTLNVNWGELADANVACEYNACTGSCTVATGCCLFPVPELDTRKAAFACGAGAPYQPKKGCWDLSSSSGCPEVTTDSIPTPNTDGPWSCYANGCVIMPYCGTNTVTCPQECCTDTGCPDGYFYNQWDCAA
jgi:hypothetical protein